MRCLFECKANFTVWIRSMECIYTWSQCTPSFCQQMLDANNKHLLAEYNIQWWCVVSDKTIAYLIGQNKLLPDNPFGSYRATRQMDAHDLNDLNCPSLFATNDQNKFSFDKWCYRNWLGQSRHHIGEMCRVVGHSFRS